MLQIAAAAAYAALIRISALFLPLAPRSTPENWILSAVVDVKKGYRPFLCANGLWGSSAGIPDGDTRNTRLAHELIHLWRDGFEPDIVALRVRVETCQA